ncbi:type 1 fimbrial protein, partial [Salmonella enterica subsp. enterica serovar Napoli]|nr:type 1 fimbrial protein [Salmonella enterica subsp. enterica serovar Napoli]
MMKKFVAGKGAAGLILAGLMVSSVAMAAAGDAVTGGSGTVKINVPLVTSTCTVTVPTEVNFDPINKNNLSTVPGQIVASKNFDITLSHCSGRAIKMAVSANGSPDMEKVYSFMDSGDPDHALIYDIQIPTPGAGITGGDVLGDQMAYDFSGNKPFT